MFIFYFVFIQNKRISLISLPCKRLYKAEEIYFLHIDVYVQSEMLGNSVLACKLGARVTVTQDKRKKKYLNNYIKRANMTQKLCRHQKKKKLAQWP